MPSQARLPPGTRMAAAAVPTILMPRHFSKIGAPSKLPEPRPCASMYHQEAASRGGFSGKQRPQDVGSGRNQLRHQGQDEHQGRGPRPRKQERGGALWSRLAEASGESGGRAFGRYRWRAVHQNMRVEAISWVLSAQVSPRRTRKVKS